MEDLVYDNTAPFSPVSIGYDERWTTAPHKVSATGTPSEAPEANPSEGVVVEAPEFDPDTDEGYNDMKAYVGDDYAPETHLHLESFGIASQDWNSTATEMMEHEPGLKDAIESNADWMIHNGMIEAEEYDNLRESGLINHPYFLAYFGFGGNEERAEEYLREVFPDSPWYGGQGFRGREDRFVNPTN